MVPRGAQWCQAECGGDGLVDKDRNGMGWEVGVDEIRVLERLETVVTLHQSLSGDEMSEKVREERTTLT